MAEQWRSIADFPGYEVSDQGRVRSYWSRSSNGKSRGAHWKVTEQVQRILAAPVCGHYPQVNLRRDGRSFGRRIHRLVAETFLGPCPDSLELCHDDGDPTNNRIDNLRYDTHKANMRDAVGHGKFGERFSSLDQQPLEEMPIVNVRIDGELYQRLRNYMLQERRPNQSEAIRLLLEDALDAADGPRVITVETLTAEELGISTKPQAGVPQMAGPGAQAGEAE